MSGCKETAELATKVVKCGAEIGWVSSSGPAVKPQPSNLNAGVGQVEVQSIDRVALFHGHVLVCIHVVCDMQMVDVRGLVCPGADASVHEVPTFSTGLGMLPEPGLAFACAFCSLHAYHSASHL